MNGLDDTLVDQVDDTLVGAPLHFPARIPRAVARRRPLSRRRADVALVLVAAALATWTGRNLVDARPVFEVLGPYVHVDVEVDL